MQLIRRCLLALLFILPVSMVQAHHGWSTFDSSKAYYIKGTVEYVRWGNPHSEVEMTVDVVTLPDGLRTRELPPGANPDNGAATLASARPYDGDEDRIHLVLAGPGWMERWGLDRPLEEGEVIEVLGFISNEESDALRPVMFWTGDGQGVWQQLTVFSTPPEPAN